MWTLKKRFQGEGRFQSGLQQRPQLTGSPPLILPGLQFFVLDGDGSVGLQEFQQFKIGPFQASLPGEKAKYGKNSHNFSARFQSDASSQIALMGKERRTWLAIPKLAHALMNRSAKHAHARGEGLKSHRFHAPRPG